MAEKSGNAPLCNMSLKLKKQCYPIERGSGYKYLNISSLINKNNTGILQKIELIEEEIFNQTESKLTSWRIKQLKKEKIQNYYNWIDDYVSKQYYKAFQGLKP